MSVSDRVRRIFGKGSGGRRSLWAALAVGLAALALTVGVGILTVAPGRATLLQGGLHLSIFVAFLVLSAVP